MKYLAGWSASRGKTLALPTRVHDVHAGHDSWYRHFWKSPRVGTMPNEAGVAAVQGMVHLHARVPSVGPGDQSRREHSKSPRPHQESTSAVAQNECGRLHRDNAPSWDEAMPCDHADMEDLARDNNHAKGIWDPPHLRPGLRGSAHSRPLYAAVTESDEHKAR